MALNGSPPPAVGRSWGCSRGTQAEPAACAGCPPSAPVAGRSSRFRLMLDFPGAPNSAFGRGRCALAVLNCSTGSVHLGVSEASQAATRAAGQPGATAAPLATPIGTLDSVPYTA